MHAQDYPVVTDLLRGASSSWCILVHLCSLTLLGNRHANSNEEERKSTQGTRRFNVENPSTKKGKTTGASQRTISYFGGVTNAEGFTTLRSIPCGGLQGII